MRIPLASLLIALTFFSESICFDLKCNSEAVPNTMLSFSSACVVYDLTITSHNDTITSIDGYENMAYSYHIILLIQNQKVRFVPRVISDFFPNLASLEISNSGLEWIEPWDISGLDSLKTLNLENNKLEIIQNGLFVYVTELETINLRGNPLKFVYKFVFVDLHKLQMLDLQQSECTQPIYDDYVSEFFPDYHNDVTFHSGNNEYLSIALDNYCQSWEDAPRISQNQLNQKIVDLQSKMQSEIDELKLRLKACVDGNAGATIACNVELTEKTIDSPLIDLACQDEKCIAIDFRVYLPNSSFIRQNSSHITSLKIHQKQTVFLPLNLAKQMPLLNELWVTESGLCEINYSVLEGLNLYTLNLTKNKISEIPLDTFAFGLTNLVKLDLSFNRIQRLYDGVFSNLKNLQRLYLHNNYLTSVTVDDLKRLKSLKCLFLQNNRLKFINTPFFTHFTSLELVNLSSNVCIDMNYPPSTLIDIEAKINDNCVASIELKCKMIQMETSKKGGNVCQVEDLIVEYNKTKISRSNGVEGLNGTVTIFFADSQSIKYLPFQLSQQFPSLRRIEIQQSKLIALQQEDFQGFSELIEIVINGNNLSSISQGTFDTIPQLELLNLSSNNIVLLPANIFVKLTSLHTLLLSNNRIVRFTANMLPSENVIGVMCADKNQLEFIETKTIHLLQKAKLIDLTNNVCIDTKFGETSGETEYISPRSLEELSDVIDFLCSIKVDF